MTGTYVESDDLYTSVGKIRKAHGIRGELFLISFSKSFDWLEDVKEAHLVKRLQDEEGKWQEVRYSFPIKKSKNHKVGCILKLDGINSRNDAENLEGAVFQVPSKLFEGGQEDSYYLKELMGFELSNREGDLLGKVSGFSHNNAQDILVVTGLNENSFEVPYVDQLIVQLDFVNKKLVMNLATGFDDLDS